MNEGDLIVQVNGIDTLTRESFKSQLIQCRPGEQVPLYIIRQEEPMTCIMEIGSPAMNRDTINNIRRIAFGIVRTEDLLNRPW